MFPGHQLLFNEAGRNLLISVSKRDDGIIGNALETKWQKRKIDVEVMSIFHPAFAKPYSLHLPLSKKMWV